MNRTLIEPKVQPLKDGMKRKIMTEKHPFVIGFFDIL